MELLPEALATFDARKAAVVKQLAALLSDPRGTLNQLAGSFKDDVNQRNNQTLDALRSGDMAAVTASANQGMPPAVAPASAAVVQALKSQLLPSQVPVFERIYAATLNPQHALEETRRMTSLMTPPGVTP